MMAVVKAVCTEPQHDNAYGNGVLHAMYLLKEWEEQVGLDIRLMDQIGQCFLHLPSSVQMPSGSVENVHASV
jgi:hypothetical protein